MDFFADTVFHFTEALGLKHLCLVGHSMGGQVAMATAIKYPQCAEKLALCAPAGFEVFTEMEKSMYHSALHLIDYISSDENNLRQTIENSFYHKPEQGEGIVAELVNIMKTYRPNYYKKMLDGCIMSMLDDSVYDRLHLIKLPVLVIFGDHDALIPNKLIHHTTTAKLAADAVKQLPDATLKIIPDCGHFVQWEKADEVNKEIAAFVKSKP
jgi:pimeloyl-ACP methyl ester carboxylesterase